MSAARPGAVTAAAVLAIIYGGLFSLCGLIGVATIAAQGGMGKNMFAGGDANQEKLQRELEKALDRDVPAYQAVQIGGAIVSLVLALALLMGGIGLLSMRGWARTLALLAGFVAMLYWAFQAVYQTVYVIPAINDAFQAMLPGMIAQGAGPKGQDALRMVETVVTLIAVAMVIFNVLIIIYLFIIVMLLCRRHVRAAFAGAALGGPDYDDGRQSPDRQDEEYEDGWGASRPQNPEDDWRYR